MHLDFRGVTITDGLGAGALRTFGGFAQRAVLAANAGVDLMLCSTQNVDDNNPANGLAALNGLDGAIASHRLGRATAGAVCGTRHPAAFGRAASPAVSPADLRIFTTASPPGNAIGCGLDETAATCAGVRAGPDVRALAPIPQPGRRTA